MTGSSVFLIFFSIFFFDTKLLYALKHSTKTAYLDSFTDEQLNFINNVENYKLNNCIPEQLYIFLRHGSRYPNLKHVHKSQMFLERVKEFRKSQKSFDEKAVVDEIFLTFHDKPHHGLSGLGAEEMRTIAERFKQRYPFLFDYNSKDEIMKHINFVSSDKDRCIDSGRNFINGLYGHDSNLAEFLHNNIIVNNTMIRTFDDCERYQVEVKRNKKKNIHLATFLNGTEMRNLKENFKLRNNLTNFDFDTSLLSKFFGLCGIENAHRMEENWCKLFEKDELEILTYLNDLKDFWIKSYGNEINSKVVLLIVKDMFEEMEKAIRNNVSKKKVLLRFGHAENIIPLITALGLFKDADGLKHDNLNENRDRLFRTDVFSPFAANLAFVLHKCNSTNSDSAVYEQYKVNVLVNELPVDKIRAGDLKCSLNNNNKKEKNSFCNYEEFKSQMSEFVSSDLNESCKPRILRTEL